MSLRKRVFPPSQPLPHSFSGAPRNPWIGELGGAPRSPVAGSQVPQPPPSVWPQTEGTFHDSSNESSE
jgi:hypothetical protein